MFTATLFTITRTWKQPKYPSMEEWVNMMWYTHTHTHKHTHTIAYYSTIKKEQNNAICSGIYGLKRLSY